MQADGSPPPPLVRPHPLSNALLFFIFLSLSASTHSLLPLFQPSASLHPQPPPWQGMARWWCPWPHVPACHLLGSRPPLLKMECSAHQLSPVPKKKKETKRKTFGPGGVYSVQNRVKT